MHLRHKDFSMVDDLCLIIVRHPSDFFKFYTFSNNFEAMSKEKVVVLDVQVCDSTYCQTPELLLFL